MWCAILLLIIVEVCVGGTPTAPTVSGCSSDSYIEENSPVNCTCSTTGLGQPAGRLVWRRLGVPTPIVAGDYGNDSLVMSLVLTRSDHNVTQFRCDVDWETDVPGSPLTFQVGYKPEGVSLSLNSGFGKKLTVKENTPVFLTCLADSRPAATMTVRNYGENPPSTYISGPSPLNETFDPALCGDTRTYECKGINQFGTGIYVKSQVFVPCSPRSTSTNLTSINYREEPASVSFDVTAYPPPHSPLPITYLGPGGADPPSSPYDIKLNASCLPKYHLFVCTVTVLEMTSEAAAGVYTVRLTNTEGSQLYTFNVFYKVATPPIAGQESEGKEGVDTVTVALAVVLSVVVIALIVMTALVVWLCRRRRQTINAADHSGSPITSADTDHSGSPITSADTDHYDSPSNPAVADHNETVINSTTADHNGTVINSPTTDLYLTLTNYPAADLYLTPIPTTDHN